MKAASENHSSAGPTRKREPLARDVVDLTAQRLCVMAHPSRIALLELLNDGEAGVQEMADAVGLTHQIASRHLAILHQAGMLSRRRQGAMTLYAVTDWSAWWVIEQIARWVESCQDEQGASAPTE
ncbi:MAG TPA: metalloregulator ArsR/SmtB family transcription factor [Solirubrobacterales bacterium]|nr:metalloregulator ArsR/SmtB family transcription factor [Solirubrobacterales bacterium]